MVLAKRCESTPPIPIEKSKEVRTSWPVPFALYWVEAASLRAACIKMLPHSTRRRSEDSESRKNDGAIFI